MEGEIFIRSDEAVCIKASEDGQLQQGGQEGFGVPDTPARTLWASCLHVEKLLAESLPAADPTGQFLSF